MFDRLHRWVSPTRFLMSSFLVVALLVLVCGCTDQIQPGQYTPTAASPTPEIKFPCIPDNSVQTAVVTKIVDGDTVWVRIDGESYKVRYIGMNTPEIGDAGADEATALNAELVSGKTVTLYKDTSETDKYGRLLRYVVADGMFVNAELVKQGVAEPGTCKPDTSCAEYLFSMER
jgi:micrococcal nuclease